MHRFRGQWLALFGGILLLTLSVSTVFGARPEGTDGNRGQTISSFVHSVVFGDETGDETGDEELVEEELTDEELVEEELTDEELVEEELVENGEASAHGECVSAVAQDKEAIGGPNDNHGGAVSEAARVTCSEPEEVEEEVVEEEVVEEEVVEEPGSHGACVSAVARDMTAIGGVNTNHGGAVSEAARVACRDDSETEEEVVEEGSETEAISTEVVSTDADAETTADRPGNGHGRDKANRPGRSGRGQGRGNR